MFWENTGIVFLWVAWVGLGPGFCTARYLESVGAKPKEYTKPLRISLPKGRDMKLQMHLSLYNQTARLGSMNCLDGRLKIGGLRRKWILWSRAPQSKGQPWPLEKLHKFGAGSCKLAVCHFLQSKGTSGDFEKRPSVFARLNEHPV